MRGDEHEGDKMPATSNLLTDFANLPPDRESLSGKFWPWWVAYGPRLHSQPINFFTIRNDDRVFCRNREAIATYTQNPFSQANIDFVAESDPAYMEGMEVVANHVKKIRGWCDNFAQGMGFPLALDTDLFKNMVKLGFIGMERGKTPGKIKISQRDGFLADQLCAVEDYVDALGLFLPAVSENHEINLDWTKKCIVCGKYYQAKGPKAVYCSEACRSRDRRERVMKT